MRRALSFALLAMAMTLGACGGPGPTPTTTPEVAIAPVPEPLVEVKATPVPPTPAPVSSPRPTPSLAPVSSPRPAPIPVPAVTQTPTPAPAPVSPPTPKPTPVFIPAPLPPEADFEVSVSEAALELPDSITFSMEGSGARPIEIVDVEFGTEHVFSCASSSYWTARTDFAPGEEGLGFLGVGHASPRVRAAGCAYLVALESGGRLGPRVSYIPRRGDILR